jgi:glycosyltransferase involved in cell wall biosynthesis
MKKILILTRSLSITEGQGRYSVELIKKLVNDYKITIYTSELPKLNEKDLNGLNLKIKKIPDIKKLTNLKVFLLETLKMFPDYLKADIIHSFSDYPYCVFFSFIPKFIKRRFFTVHGTYGVAPFEHKKSSFLLKLSYKTAHKVFCVSNFTKNEILKKIKLNNLVVIHNGINLEKFNKKQVSKKSNEQKIILSVGNLKNRKGFHVSVPAVMEVMKKIPNLIYYIVGSKPDNDYLEEIKKNIRDNGLENKIILLENLSDNELLNLYYKCDIFLLTPIVVNKNKFEGFGLVYLEANACGKPVIGTKGCGAEDAIKNNQTGLLVDQNNIHETAEALIKILSNKDMAERFEKNGLKWVKKFNWSIIADKYKKYY